ncbi:MAG: FKBP-type peptidyl-prolyl cis-trans isomerase [Bacteroidales bacterium]|nr:FKBP-type peptidyl-prolyl cis-trans isomerase [Bacteroidales bacterium]MDT8431359.1 FKBP-type peptidyl-prolyl cis-trans isomerase [Bacteroidales bacterium]
MMKGKFAVVLVLLCFALPITAQKKVKLENRKDSLSYMVGVSMYQGTMQFQLTLDYDMVAKGFLAAADSNAVMDAETANNYIRRVSEQVNAEKLVKTKELGLKFLAENRKEEGIIETQSGLQYRVIQEGAGPSPSPESNVKVHYTGYLLDGTKFDSSHDRGEPAEFPVNRVIPGWTEVLQLMKPGAEYVVYIPPHLGYGDRQMGGDIPAGSTLIFEIELLDITQ